MSADLILARPRDGRACLIPATQHDMEEFTAAIPPGRDVRAKLTMPRSLPQHRFYWGLLALCVQNHPFYSTTEALHIWLKLKQGLVDHIELHDGRIHIRAASTSFEQMDGTTFKRYLDTSINLIVTDILKGVKRSDLIREVEKMIGVDFQALKVAA